MRAATHPQKHHPRAQRHQTERQHIGELVAVKHTLIVRKGREDVVKRIFDKWDLEAVPIGQVTSDGMMRVRHGGRIVAEIPARRLADDAPVYHRAVKTPAPSKPWAREELAAAPDPHEALLRVIGSPTIASKRWIYRQYDHMVRDGTVVAPGSDAAVVRIPFEQPDGSILHKFIAITNDCNGGYCALDPFVGGQIAVAEAARNITCSGARPLAVTDNLNFGNPHVPENFFRLRRCVEGIALACEFFKTPVIGGNVSLYNQSPKGTVDPTPTIGMVGLFEDPSHITTQYFKAAGDVVMLLGEPGRDLGGSVYLRECFGLRRGPCPALDLAREAAVQSAVRALIAAGFCRSAHDCSEGGLGAALVESCVANADAWIGCEIDLSAWGHLRWDELLFNECQSRVVISVRQGDLELVWRLLAPIGVPATVLGHVGGRELIIRKTAERRSWSIAKLADIWGETIGRHMDGGASSMGA